MNQAEMLLMDTLQKESLPMTIADYGDFCSEMFAGCEVKPRFILFPPGWRVLKIETELPEYII